MFGLKNSERAFLRFYFTDGISARFIQGGYTIKRIQTSAGWIVIN